MRLAQRILCCLSGIGLVASALAGPARPLNANYYVSPKGSDDAAGTIDRPFATLQRALDTAQPGQLIYIRGGTYTPAAVTTFKKSGQRNAFIELHAYPGELPVIDGAKVPGSEPTWRFVKASCWRIRGPLHLTNGRGAGVFIDRECQSLELELIESSYNGKMAERGGHGFQLLGDNVRDITFRNCDAHHNANHRTHAKEDVDANIYQHGDGFRIFCGTNVRLVGCRAWHNLDDGYDLTQARETIELVDCWAAYSGIDDARGSITGKPNWGIRRFDGDGFKLGYNDDTGPHRTVRCLAWNNHSHGWNVAGGPYTLQHCVAFNNGEDAFFGLASKANEIRNSYAFKNRAGNGTWAKDAVAFTVSESEFAGVNDAGMLGPRRPGGNLPETDFLRLAAASRLIDVGVDLSLPFKGRAPDIGHRESGKP